MIRPIFCVSAKNDIFWENLILGKREKIRNVINIMRQIAEEETPKGTKNTQGLKANGKQGFQGRIENNGVK